MNQYPTTYLGIPIEIEKTLLRHSSSPDMKLWAAFTAELNSRIPDLKKMVRAQVLSRIPIKVVIEDEDNSNRPYFYASCFDYDLSAYQIASMFHMFASAGIGCCPEIVRKFR